MDLSDDQSVLTGGFADVDFDIEINKGDIFKVGDHILICGDSYDSKTINYIMKNHKPICMFTDPPYNVDCAVTDVSNLGDRIEELNVGRLTEFDLDFLLSKKIPSLYMCCNVQALRNYMNLLYKYGYYFRVHVMVKRNCNHLFLSGGYINDLEYILYGKQPGALINKDLPTDFYNQWQEYKDDFNTSEKSEATFVTSHDAIKEKFTSTHPTVKPLKIIIPRVAISSNEGDYVLDAFLGSGSTLIACERLHRKCVGVEYTDIYCLETMKRYIKVTGKRDIDKIGNLYDGS